MVIVSKLGFPAPPLLKLTVFELFNQSFPSTFIVSINIADGKGSFPLVMVGGVLEGNKGWGIAQEVINCISKDYPGVVPIWPKVKHIIQYPLVSACILPYHNRNAVLELL